MRKFYESEQLVNIYIYIYSDFELNLIKLIKIVSNYYRYFVHKLYINIP